MEDMRDIIEQIIQIDAVAFENEQKNQLIIAREKQKYENEINKYRDYKLKTAEERANDIYNQIKSSAQNEYKEKEDEMKKNIMLMDSKFLKVEKDVIKNILEKLFTLT